MNAPDAPFEEPWQAQLFAMTVALNEVGAFTWTDWAATFGPKVQDQGADVYWRVWSDTLVALLEASDLADPDEISALTKRWQAAARATPHGQPIVLSAADDPADDR